MNWFFEKYLKIDIKLFWKQIGYPIHVNEAPHFFQPKNKDKVCIFYSASGSWTPYYCVGLLTADANGKLIDTLCSPSLAAL